MFRKLLTMACHLISIDNAELRIDEQLLEGLAKDGSIEQ